MERTWLTLALAVCLVASSASAGPVIGPNWVVDTPTELNVLFAHGAIAAGADHELGPFVSPGENWEVTSVKITEINAGAPSGDSVALAVTVRHIVAPPGHILDDPEGVIYDSATLILDAGEGSIAAFHSLEVDHLLVHSDTYVTSLVTTVTFPNIDSYLVGVTGSHPNPVPTLSSSALALMCLLLLTAGILATQAPDNTPRPT